MSGINDLPIELYQCIFRNLSIDDLFNCRLVNKKFDFSTRECVSRLVIGGPSLSINDHHWYDNEPINNTQLISFERLNKIKWIFNMNYVKCLKIWLKDDFQGKYFKSDYIYQNMQFNFFNNLEYYDIYLHHSYDVNPIIRITMDFENLKYFKAYCYGTEFELNTPKLKRIETNNIRNIRFKSNPESIKHLIIPCDNHQNSFNLLKQFKNLEIIEHSGLDFRDVVHYSDDPTIEHPIDPHFDIQILNKNNLSYFNNLKQLKFYCPYSYNKDNEIDIIYRILEENFNNKLSDLKKLKKKIDIYFQGVQIMNIQKLKEFKSSKSIYEYQLNNIDLFDLPRDKKYFMYNELNDSYNNLRNDLPPIFFEKYQNLASVSVHKKIDYRSDDRSIDGNKRIDTDDLNWFLNNLKCLIELRILWLPLDQIFFNNLPNTIKYLEIYYIKQKFDLNLNFNFILKFTELIMVDIHVGFSSSFDPFDLVLDSFSNLKYLKKFQFNFNGNDMIINRIDKQFTIFERVEVKSSNYRPLLLNYDQFVQELYEIKNTHCL